MLRGVAEQLVEIGAQAGTTAATAAGAGAGIGAGVAAAGVTAGLSALAVGIVAWLNRKGPKQKIAATQVVEEAAALMEKNRDAYLASARTAADQQVALQNFDALWARIVEQCSSLGEPGKRCISERQPGGKWDYAAYYRTPISSDTPTSSGNPIDTVTAGITGALQSFVGGPTTTSGTNIGPLVLLSIGALFLIAGGSK